MRIPSSNPTLSSSFYLNCSISNLADLLSAAAISGHAAELHGHLIISNALSHPYLHSLLVSLYARCGHLPSAIDTLLSLPSAAPTPAACTAVLSRLSRSPCPDESLVLFSILRHGCLLPHPNPFTFSALLPACRSFSSGSQLHSLALKHGVAQDLFVSSALTSMYARYSHMCSANQAFHEMPVRNLVSWNALIVGYYHNRFFHSAILTFRDLIHLADPSIRPDQVTFSSVLSACANSGELVFGLAAHCLVVKLALDSLIFVNNSLIDMYSKCNRGEDARKLFDLMPLKGSVTWNVLISSLVETDRFEEGGGLFLSMRRLGVEPDEASFSTILHASSSLAEFLLGAEIHCQVLKFGFIDNRCISSSLITMYSKCGSLDDAQLVFSCAKHHLNVVSWTSMIAALQQHGEAERVLQMFEEMLQFDLEPDHITFVCVLSACSHAGLVEKGFEYFASMSRDHGKIPWNEHYACMVDMLGRAGRLDDARGFIDGMQVQPSASVWGALLGACRNRRNLEMGEEVAYRLFEMEPHNPGNYVLLSNLYAAHGKTDEADGVRRLMGINGVRKETSCSWIEVRSKTFVFTVQDRSHGRTREIYEMMRRLEVLVKMKAGLEYSINGIDHSERIALCFGLLSLPECAPIRIKKNIRTCGDCHGFMKLVSGALQREIILRDLNRFHRFANGLCSCKDYW